MECCSPLKPETAELVAVAVAVALLPPEQRAVPEVPEAVLPEVAGLETGPPAEPEEEQEAQPRSFPSISMPTAPSKRVGLNL